jgi:hypothetical protein
VLTCMLSGRVLHDVRQLRVVHKPYAGMLNESDSAGTGCRSITAMAKSCSMLQLSYLFMPTRPAARSHTPGGREAQQPAMQPPTHPPSQPTAHSHRQTSPPDRGPLVCLEIAIPHELGICAAKGVGRQVPCVCHRLILQ